MKGWKLLLAEAAVLIVMNMMVFCVMSFPFYFFFPALTVIKCAALIGVMVGIAETIILRKML